MEWLIQEACPEHIKMAFARTDTRFWFIFYPHSRLVISRQMINVREPRSFLKQVEQVIDLCWIIPVLPSNYPSLLSRTPNSLHIITWNYPSSSQIISALRTASHLVESIPCTETLRAAPLTACVPLEPSDKAPCGTHDVNRWSYVNNYVKYATWNQNNVKS